MLVIELRFPAGRFHATPWGRNVNEGVVEWPPAPYRLARALIDAAKRRHPAWPDERMESILRCLSAPVSFLLPPATGAHTRAYLNSNQKDPQKKQKIFDAFVVVERKERTLMAFDTDAPESVRRDLDDLLGELNYFGRSESWVQARLLPGSESIAANCMAAGTLSGRTERVEVACLCNEAEYRDLPYLPETGKKKNRRTLSWMEAVCMSTADLLKDGWSHPPAQRTQTFGRPADALTTRPRARPTRPTAFRVARYALHSTVLPRVIETVSLAERLRAKLMGIHKRISGNDASAVSARFSGKGPGGTPDRGHNHIYILPLDEDGDGRIDHVIVRSDTPFDQAELQALDAMNRTWQPNGRPDLRLVLVRLADGDPLPSTARWISATPFVTARHHRRGRGDYLEWAKEEVRRECINHGIPVPVSIEPIDRTRTPGHAVRWMEFQRSRKGGRPLRGHGFALTFDDPVTGPFAIGSLAHFGLGTFVPENAEE